MVILILGLNCCQALFKNIYKGRQACKSWETSGYILAMLVTLHVFPFTIHSSIPQTWYFWLFPMLCHKCGGEQHVQAHWMQQHRDRALLVCWVRPWISCSRGKQVLAHTQVSRLQMQWKLLNRNHPGFCSSLHSARQHQEKKCFKIHLFLWDAALKCP